MRFFHFLFLLSIMVLTNLPSTLSAQSTALAPTLDGRLKSFIRAMQPLTNQPAPALTEKPLLITFFASWCPPCGPEFAEINELRNRFPATAVEMIAINIFEQHFEDAGGIRMKRFLRRTKPAFPVLRPTDEPLALKKLGNLDRIPTVYLYSGSGHPIYTFIHQQDAAKTHITATEIAPHIAAALAAKKP